jgi:hypothetical protein
MKWTKYYIPKTLKTFKKLFSISYSEKKLKKCLNVSSDKLILSTHLHIYIRDSEYPKLQCVFKFDLNSNQ